MCDKKRHFAKDFRQKQRHYTGRKKKKKLKSKRFYF